MKIVVANWKMNGDFEFADKFVTEINTLDLKNTVVVCPPVALISRFHGFRYCVGAQNCFCEEKGAFTGENSPKLLKDAGCEYIILGHSERRSIFHETEDLIFRKWQAALLQKLIPIVCVGENTEDRSNWKQVIRCQLDYFLKEQLHNTIFAYEPVWSIGTGLIPTIEEIEIVFEFIHNLLGNKVHLIYGGSVNSKNAKQILNSNNVDGLLVGGASLKIDEFKRILIQTEKI
ncbi:MAG: triose-phosphate isomerase [Holosporaceae bacterium]|jgi:triosephosphate isomerase|nr:triose-phosphate isomerase [Holosporaceae bacterium]